MMAQVTTSGTAAGTGLPAGTHAKTGTAEYGVGPESKLKIDGWLMGYYGDIASGATITLFGAAVFAIVYVAGLIRSRLRRAEHDDGAGSDGAPVGFTSRRRSLDRVDVH